MQACLHQLQRGASTMRRLVRVEAVHEFVLQERGAAHLVALLRVCFVARAVGAAASQAEAAGWGDATPAVSGPLRN